MDSATRQMLQAVDKRIGNLQQIRRLIIEEFGDSAGNPNEATVLKQGRPSKQKREHAKHPKKGGTRKLQMHAWLKANGPATRGEIIAGTGFPGGTVGSLLGQCPDLFESRDGKWHARQ